jgi:hypothetical protein
MKTVLDVTLKELVVVIQIAHVKMVTILMLITIVKNVLSDVLLVKVLLIIVLLVSISEPQPLLAHVHLDIMN